MWYALTTRKECVYQLRRNHCTHSLIECLGLPVLLLQRVHVAIVALLQLLQEVLFHSVLLPDTVDPLPQLLHLLVRPIAGRFRVLQLLLQVEYLLRVLRLRDVTLLLTLNLTLLNVRLQPAREDTKQYDKLTLKYKPKY